MEKVRQAQKSHEQERDLETKCVHVYLLCPPLLEMTLSLNSLNQKWTKYFRSEYSTFAGVFFVAWMITCHRNRFLIRWIKYLHLAYPDPKFMGDVKAGCIKGKRHDRRSWQEETETAIEETCSSYFEEFQGGEERRQRERVERAGKNIPQRKCWLERGRHGKILIFHARKHHYTPRKTQTL